MSLLNKFEKVKIDTSKTMLKGKDAEVCSAFETDYLNAFRFYETEIEFFEINRENNQYLNFEGAIEKIEEYVESLSERFVHDITRHFAGTYKIDLSEKEIKDSVFPDYDGWRNGYHIREAEIEKGVKAHDRIQKYRIPISKILAEIQGKLGGMSLEEKSENELKENFYKSFAKPWGRDWRSDKYNPVVKVIKNRIEFERGLYVEANYSNGYRWPYSGNDANYLFQTLSFLESGKANIINTFATLMGNSHMSPEYIFSEIEFDNLEKVKSIRLYKNRKMVIKFQSDEIANEFFKVWCKSGILVGKDD